MHMQDQDKNESALRELFDSTAAAASEETVHRMARQAAQIPERHRSPSWARWTRPFVFVFALAAGAAATTLLLGTLPDSNSPRANSSTPTGSQQTPNSHDDGWLAELGLEDDEPAEEEDDSDDPLGGFSLGWSANIAPLDLLQSRDDPSLEEAVVVLDEMNAERNGSSRD